MTDRTIEKSIYIAASPETVWTYLTKSSELAKWFHKPDENLNDGEAFDIPNFSHTNPGQPVNQKNIATRKNVLEYFRCHYFFNSTVEFRS